MWSALVALGLAVGVGSEIKSALEPEVPVGAFSNTKLLNEDKMRVYKGEMTQKQFNRNIQDGKYVLHLPRPNYELWEKRILKYIKYRGKMSSMDKMHLEYVRERRTENRQLDESILSRYEFVDNISDDILNK